MFGIVVTYFLAMHFGWITKSVGLGVLVTLGILLACWWGLYSADQSRVRIVFLSVGQGDAILIQSGFEQVLIDGGRDGRVLLDALARELPLSDRYIEAVIMTHPDADHIGGLPAVFDRYRIGQFITTGAESTTDDMLLLKRSLEHHAIPQTVPGRLGVTISFPRGGTLTLLYPVSLPLSEGMESNEGSVVARFDFGETSFLLTGDLPREEEALPTMERVDVLKAAHHGSASSTSEAWLDLVRPREVILSVGKNSYGHPAGEILQRLEQRGITTWRTDRDGSIAYRCLLAEHQCKREE